jgi:hypothetical protein
MLILMLIFDNCCRFYHNDPVLNPLTTWDRPPIKNIFCIYGIDLKTEVPFSNLVIIVILIDILIICRIYLLNMHCRRLEDVMYLGNHYKPLNSYLVFCLIRAYLV